MSRTARFVGNIMLLLILGSLVMPVYAAASACVGMPCHQDRSDKLGGPMRDDCCGTGLCADAPEATTPEPTAVAAPVQQHAALLSTAVAEPAPATSRTRGATVTHSPPRPTGARLALLATLLI